ncbi:MAG TPA: hypothetical protein VMU16_03585 [Candidatus Binataceae bacterium]|nr:hypothetical protein [Candidatus Binataceae bacterium]
METAGRQIEHCESVRTWRKGLIEQWGGDPLAEEPEKLVALERFCAFIGEDPDTIVKRCFRIRKEDGERVVSVKWRAHYAEKIKEFRDRSNDPDSRRSTADVLSFLIHNGVLLQV